MTSFTRPRTQVGRVRSSVHKFPSSPALYPINARHQMRRNYDTRAMIYDVVAPRDTRHVRCCGLFSRGTARKSDCDFRFTTRELYYKRNVRADRPASFRKIISKSKFTQDAVAAVVYSITEADSPRHCIPTRIAIILCALGT